MRKQWTAEDVDRLRRMRGEGRSARECADALGRSYGSVKNKLQHDGISAPVERTREERFEHQTKNDTATITSVSDRIRTPADAIA